MYVSQKSHKYDVRVWIFDLTDEGANTNPNSNSNPISKYTNIIVKNFLHIRTDCGFSHDYHSKYWVY